MVKNPRNVPKNMGVVFLHCVTYLEIQDLQITMQVFFKSVYCLI